MTSHVIVGGFVAALLSASSLATAQGSSRRPNDPSTPTEPHERMTFFEGTWTTDGKPDAANGTPAPVNHEERCGWLPGGRRHMVCRSWRASGGARPETMYVLSYRASDSTYIAHFTFPNGSTLTYHGRPEGDRWVMNLQPMPMWPANNRLRTIITAVPEGLRYVEESSVDGGPWKITEDYRHKRVP